MRKTTGIAATLAAAGLVAAGMAAPASAAPKNKGTTYVMPSDLTGAVLEDVLRPGSLSEQMGAGFGIVGNPSSGVIKHVGGLAIDGSAGILKDSYLEIRNFWINTKTGMVSGDVENLGRADLFSLDNVVAVDESTITATLRFTETVSLAVGLDVTDEVAGEATVMLK